MSRDGTDTKKSEPVATKAAKKSSGKSCCRVSRRGADATGCADGDADVREKRPLPAAPTPAHVRRFIREQLAANLPEIFDGLIQLARSGDLAAIRILLQMAEPVKKPLRNTGGTGSTGLTEKQLGFARKTLAELRKR